MSTLGTIASKTYGAVALEERNLVLEPGVAYQRLTSLPDNWTNVRIALVLSFTNTSELNGDPVEENPFGASPVMQPWVGLTNGAGLPGTPGVKFLGSGMTNNGEHGYPCSLMYVGDSCLLTYNRNPSGGLRGAGIISDGATIIRSGNGSDTVQAKMDTPAGPTNFAFAWMTDILTWYDAYAQRSYMRRNQQVIANVSNPDLAVNQAMAIGPAYNEESLYGGWWDNETTFAGCRHLFIRWPFLNNRLRIHTLKVMQLA